MTWQRTFPSLCLLACLAAPAAAHDMWLVPQSYRPPLEQAVGVQVRIGHAGQDEPVARDDRRIVRFSVIGPQGEDSLPGLPGSDPAGYFRPSVAGSYALLYTSHPAFSELPAERFTAYLQEEGLDRVIHQRQARGQQHLPGRELYSRSLKSLVQAGKSRALQDRPYGLPLELVLEDHGTAGATLRLFFQGKPLAGALIKAAPASGAPRQEGRTAQDGRLRLPLSQGRWLVTTVHTEPSDAPQAEWETIFASLTFEM